MAKLKYLFLFVLVTGAAYAGSTVFLSYLDAEIGKALPLSPPAKSSLGNKPGAPLPSPDDSESLTKRALS